MYLVVLRVVSDVGDVCSRLDFLFFDNSNIDWYRNVDFVGLSCIYCFCLCCFFSYSGSR